VTAKKPCDGCGKPTRRYSAELAAPYCGACQKWQPPSWTDGAPAWDEAKVQAAIISRDVPTIIRHLLGILRSPIRKTLRKQWQEIDRQALECRIEDGIESVIAHAQDRLPRCLARIAATPREITAAEYLRRYYIDRCKSLVRDSIKSQERGGITKWNGRSPFVKQHRDMLRHERPRVPPKRRKLRETIGPEHDKLDVVECHTARIERRQRQRDNRYQQAVSILVDVAFDQARDDLRLTLRAILDGCPVDYALRMEARRRAAIGLKGGYATTERRCRDGIKRELNVLSINILLHAPGWASAWYFAMREGAVRAAWTASRRPNSAAAHVRLSGQLTA